MLKSALCHGKLWTLLKQIEQNDITRQMSLYDGDFARESTKYKALVYDFKSRENINKSIIKQLFCTAGTSTDQVEVCMKDILKGKVQLADIKNHMYRLSKTNTIIRMLMRNAEVQTFGRLQELYGPSFTYAYIRDTLFPMFPQRIQAKDTLPMDVEFHLDRLRRKVERKLQGSSSSSDDSRRAIGGKRKEVVYHLRYPVLEVNAREEVGQTDAESLTKAKVKSLKWMAKEVPVYLLYGRQWDLTQVLKRNLLEGYTCFQNVETGYWPIKLFLLNYPWGYKTGPDWDQKRWTKAELMTCIANCKGTAIYHIADVDFMKYWLRNKYFRMIK